MLGVWINMYLLHLCHTYTLQTKFQEFKSRQMHSRIVFFFWRCFATEWQPSAELKKPLGNDHDLKQWEHPLIYYYRSSTVRSASNFSLAKLKPNKRFQYDDPLLLFFCVLCLQFSHAALINTKQDPSICWQFATTQIWELSIFRSAKMRFFIGDIC